MSLPLRGETNEACPGRKASHRESEVEWVDGGYDSIHFTHCIRSVAATRAF